MARREALRQLQARLAERLQQVRGEMRPASWLAVECRRFGLLFPLASAGEIFSVGELEPVPHTQRWYAGVANLRGGLHSVIDIAVFLGLAERRERRDAALVVAINPALGAHAAVLVDRLAGLRHADQMSPIGEDSGARPAFAGARLKDEQGRVWQEIDLAALARNEQFLSIAV
jgi:twitching motility protein PilI